jgi:hypothetical protein
LRLVFRIFRIVACGFAATVFAAACKNESVHTIALSFRSQRTGGISGFDCTEPTTVPFPPPAHLADHAIQRCGGPGRISVAADLLSFGGAPRCDTASMITWCRNHTCAPVPGSRVCVSTTLGADVAPGMAAVNAVAAAIESIQGQLLTHDAPDDFVVVRVVATTEPCDALPPDNAYDCPPLLGCAISCATNLREYTPDQLELALDLGPLDLPALGASVTVSREFVCGLGVELCAGTPFASPAMQFNFCSGSLAVLPPGACE